MKPHRKKIAMYLTKKKKKKQKKNNIQIELNYTKLENTKLYSSFSVNLI